MQKKYFLLKTPSVYFLIPQASLLGINCYIKVIIWTQSPAHSFLKGRVSVPNIGKTYSFAGKGKGIALRPIVSSL